MLKFTQSCHLCVLYFPFFWPFEAKILESQYFHDPRRTEKQKKTVLTIGTHKKQLQSIPKCVRVFTMSENRPNGHLSGKYR